MLSKPFRFGRLQPRTSSSADARQQARSSCFHSSKRLQKSRRKKAEKGNISPIIRHEIRQITDETRGQPIISQAVVHGNVATARRRTDSAKGSSRISLTVAVQLFLP